MKKENENALILDPPCRFRRSMPLDGPPESDFCGKGNMACEECRKKGLGYEPIERTSERKERRQKEAAQRIGFRIGQMIVYYGISVLLLASLAALFNRPISLFRMLCFVAVMDFLQIFRDYCFRESPPRSF